MGSISVEEKKVKALLDCIETDELGIFLGLEDKKASPAIMAFYSVALHDHTHAINALNQTMKNLLKAVQGNKGFFQEKVGVVDADI